VLADWKSEPFVALIVVARLFALALLSGLTASPVKTISATIAIVRAAAHVLCWRNFWKGISDREAHLTFLIEASLIKKRFQLTIGEETVGVAAKNVS
jgi:hypothetical protein